MAERSSGGLTLSDRLWSAALGAFFSLPYGLGIAFVRAYVFEAPIDLAFVGWTAATFAVIGLLAGQFVADILASLLYVLLGLLSALSASESGSSFGPDSSWDNTLLALFCLGVVLGLLLLLA